MAVAGDGSVLVTDLARAVLQLHRTAACSAGAGDVAGDQGVKPAASRWVGLDGVGLLVAKTWRGSRRESVRMPGEQRTPRGPRFPRGAHGGDVADQDRVPLAAARRREATPRRPLAQERLMRA